MKILVTRPEPEATELARTLSEAGHQVVKLPLLQIELLEVSLPVLSQNLIFVSKNAVRGFFKNAGDAKGKTLFAVGPGTANLLQAKGFTVLYPDSTEGSKALLALPALQNVQDQTFILVSGTNGREDISEGLCARGAQVERCCVYTSTRIPLDDAQITLLRAPYDQVIITSLDALRYACECGISAESTILVMSSAMLAYARGSGLESRLY